MGSADVRLGEGCSSYSWHSITSVDLYFAASGLLCTPVLQYSTAPLLQYPATPGFVLANGISYQGIIEGCLNAGYVSCVAEPPLISIIDDDESVREALWGLVRSVGFAVSTFASAEEFVSSDQLGNADCLILDVCMPGMSGIELQRQLVAGHSAVPVIFITAHEDEGLRAQALRGGAEAFLIKPFSEEALLNAIHAALNSQ